MDGGWRGVRVEVQHHPELLCGGGQHVEGGGGRAALVLFVLSCPPVYRHHVRGPPVCPCDGGVAGSSGSEREEEDHQGSCACLRPVQTRPCDRELPLLPLSGGCVSKEWPFGCTTAV